MPPPSALDLAAAALGTAGLKRDYDRFIGRWSLAQRELAAFDSGIASDRPFRAAPWSPEQEASVAAFVTMPERFWWSLETKTTWGSVRAHTVAIGSPFDAGKNLKNRAITGSFWEPEDAAPGPAVLVVHGVTGIDILFLDYLCFRLAQRGVRCLRIDLPDHGARNATSSGGRAFDMPSDDPDAIRRFFVQSVVEAGRASAWLTSRQGVDPLSLGIIGHSLGGMIAALTMSVDPRYARAALLMSGGDLTGVLMNPALPWRAGFVARGLDEAQLRLALRDVEPLALAARARSTESLMINSPDDGLVPASESVLPLQQALGARVEWVAGGHYAIARSAWQISRSVINHFDPRR